MEANTLLAAARLAKPNIDWVLEVTEEGAYVYNLSLAPDSLEHFTLDDEADAYALWKALARQRIEIRCSGEKGKIWMVRFNREAAIPEVFDSPEEAMLAAVETLEAMK